MARSSSGLFRQSGRGPRPAEKWRKEIQMKAALLSLAFLGSQSVTIPAMQASDRIPHLNVEALCKATSARDKAMGQAVRRATVTPETQPSNKHSTTRALPNLHRRTLVVLVYFLNAGFVSDDGRTLGR
jgi:hypothetical protein